MKKMHMNKKKKVQNEWRQREDDNITNDPFLSIQI